MITVEQHLALIEAKIYSNRQTDTNIEATGKVGHCYEPEKLAGQSRRSVQLQVNQVGQLAAVFT